MKQGTFITKLVILVMFVAVVFYIAASAWRTFNDPFSTVVSYAYTVDDSAEATGYLVRQEEVVTGQSTIVDVLPAEGEKVAAGRRWPTSTVTRAPWNARSRSAPWSWSWNSSNTPCRRTPPAWTPPGWTRASSTPWSA